MNHGLERFVKEVGEDAVSPSTRNALHEKKRKRRTWFSMLAFGLACAIMTLMTQPLFEEPLPEGVLQITPTPVQACGEPPNAEDWRVMRDDGSTDAERVIEFSQAITDWDQCITDYADGLRDYIFILEGIRDATIEQAGAYFHQFVDPSLPDPEDIPPLFIPAPEHQGPLFPEPWMLEPKKQRLDSI